MRYRRSHSPNGTFFFTVNLQDRSSWLLVDRVGPLRDAVRSVRSRYPFTIDAWVVLPDHLHAIWTMPGEDANYALRWSLIKAAFSRKIVPAEFVSRSRREKGERGIWQRRYWEHQIRDVDDYARHVDYVHFNPVKHGHVASAADWPYSSIHRHIRDGLVSSAWATTPIASIADP
jgi:putative transposase